MYAWPIENEFVFFDGKSLVTISMTPPVKSAGYSAEADFITIILSNILVGKISIWIVFLLGSNPGISIPLSIDFVYLSPSPLTYTYFPSWTETPGTDFIADAMLLAPDFLILWLERPSNITADFFCKSRTADSVFFLNVVVITTVSKELVFKVTSTFVTWLLFTTTSSISTDW